jgi:rod shape-determining protein MreD
MEPDLLMRWITYLILLYFFAALQDSHLGALPRASADSWPQIDYLLILAIFYALYAAENAAPLCGFFCGVLYDLTAGSFIGLNAVPIALVAYAIVRIRLSIFREHFISQLLITFLAVLAVGLLTGLAGQLTGTPMEGHNFATHFGLAAGNAVYSSIVAPGLFWILFRFRALLGFTSHGLRTRSHS